MGRGWVGWLAGVVGALSLMSVADAADTVRIDTGALKGVTVQAVTSFKGVPYARPPVGVWRWRPPQRPDPWPGVRDAGGYGPICMQVVINDNGVGLQSASEDCLTLNVFTPQGAAGGAKTDGRLPVMVWIHGGGFINGSGGAALYDGTRLAEQGVVVVTLNYRLGRFGFFAHPAITAETPKTYLANYGLMDQIAALQWVRRNIAAFGGDPAKVTIFGESAGGMAVNRLMMIREARGLFRAAIVQSGLGRERGQTLAEAEADGAAFAKKLGVETGDPAALRAIPAGAIVGGGEIAIAAGEAPILDGRLLMEDPADAFGAGAGGQGSLPRRLQQHGDPRRPGQRQLQAPREPDGGAEGGGRGGLRLPVGLRRAHHHRRGVRRAGANAGAGTLHLRPPHMALPDFPRFQLARQKCCRGGRPTLRTGSTCSRP